MNDGTSASDFDPCAQGKLARTALRTPPQQESSSADGTTLRIGARGALPAHTVELARRSGQREIAASRLFHALTIEQPAACVGAFPRRSATPAMDGEEHVEIAL